VFVDYQLCTLPIDTNVVTVADDDDDSAFGQ